MAVGQAIAQGADKLFRGHADDAAGVAIDIIGIVVFILLIPSGISEIAFAGAIGGGLLLYTDGRAFAMEMGGDNEGAEAYKRQTESLRLVATLITLPDLFYGGYKVIREMSEIKQLAAADRMTSTAAGNLAQRTANAQRAERYMQIVERANLRAKIRGEQLTAMMRLELRPRPAAVAGVGLFVREEILNDESLLHQFMRRLQLSCVAVHR